MKLVRFAGLVLMCAALMVTSALGDALPIDFTPGFVPDPALFTEDGYQDESITVTMERIRQDGAQYNVARVKIADPSQLRTALAAPFGKKKTNKVSTIARNNNAVVAIGGDYYANEEGGYVLRMGETYRKKPMKSRDMLIIDEAGDFHILEKSDPAQLKAFLEGDHQAINIFNFGPALVINGALQPMPASYKYNIDGLEPRCAIGQVGPLEYLLVVVDGRDAADSKGVTVETLAKFMHGQGCQQAYNLDGGNSALMVFGQENYSTKSFGAERSVSDIIYFATTVDKGLTAPGK